MLSTTFSYQALWDRDFIQAWMGVYLMVMGEFGPMADDHGDIFADHTDMRVWFILATLFLNIILLNMFISIMAQHWTEANANKGIDDPKEKLYLINKAQRFAILPRLFKWLEHGNCDVARKLDPEEKYLHCIKDAYGQDKKRGLIHQKLTDLKSMSAANFESIQKQISENESALSRRDFSLNQAI